MDHDEINERVNGAPGAGSEPGPRDAATEIEALRRRIEALQSGADTHIRAGLREHPFVALGAAVAVGFILGRVIRRL